MTAAASADQLQVSVQTATPEQGVPVTLAFSGAANSGSGPYLYAVVRPAGGIACQPSFGSDQAAAGAPSNDLFGGYNQVAPGSVSQQTTYDPSAVGGYLVCAWLESVSGDGSGNPAPANQVTAASSTTFTTRGPQVAELSVALGSQALPGVAYQINYTTQTDQELTLESVVKRAGGLPCASSYELEQQQNQAEDDILGGYTGVFGGPITTTGTDSEQTAGPYIICSWVEGPNTGEVDAAATTSIYVGMPPTSTHTPPSTTHTPPVRLTAATELSAFLRWIVSRYQDARGYWICPQAQIGGGEGFCLAEITVGRRHHWLQATAKISGGRVALQHQYDTAWTRRWSRYSKRTIAGVGTPGTASVNGPAYDWAWLAAGAHYDWQHHRRSFSVDAYDGNSLGFGHLFDFQCRVRGRTITCTNALGDSMRYRP